MIKIDEFVVNFSKNVKFSTKRIKKYEKSKKIKVTELTSDMQELNSAVQNGVIPNCLNQLENKSKEQ